jgi:hypothetical protein
VRARVAALPSPATCGRLLVHVPLDPRSLKAAAAQRTQQQQGGQKQPRQQQAQQKDAAKHPKAGEVVSAVVDSVHAAHAELTLGGARACRGRLHICEAGAEAWAGLEEGATVKVRNPSLATQSP